MKYAAVALALIGCGAAVPALPSQGGPAWRELQSEHFTVWTDGSREAGLRLVQRMEDLRQAMIGTAFRGAQANGRAFVLALRDEYESTAYTPSGSSAYAVPARGIIHQPFVVLPVETKVGQHFVTAAHELAHVISFLVISHQPRWFAEGLAEYYKTIVVDRERNVIELGRAPTYNGDPIRHARPLPFATLFACKSGSCTDWRFYSTAWALFTYLTNQRPAQLATYEQSLIDTEGNHDQAWLDAFGTASLDDLFVAMRAWLASGSHRVLSFNAALKTWPATERPLGDADVHAARALMLMQLEGREDDARREIDAALALDRTHVLAQFLAMHLPAAKRIDPAVARATTTAHPDDWRAWFMLVTALEPGDERSAAWTKACTLIAANPAIESPLKCPTP